MGYRGTLILRSMIYGIRPCSQYLKTKAVSSETSSPFASGQEFICSDQFLVLIFVNAIVAVSGSRPQFPARETKPPWAHSRQAVAVRQTIVFVFW